MKQSFSFFIILCLFAGTVHLQAQDTQAEPFSLRPGQEVPDLVLKNIINYPNPTARLSDFRGKLLVLDFWNSHCAACLQSWPKLLKLQQQFGNKMQVILVDDIESEQTVRKTFAHRKSLTGVDMNLPTACADTTIEKVFPYSSVPFIVWIDEAGKLKATTYGSSLTAKNIQDHFDGKKMEMLPVIDNNELISWTPRKPVFIDSNGGKPQPIIAQSVFARADYHLFPQTPTIGINEAEHSCFAGGNACIRDFYAMAYSDKILTHCGFKNIERPVIRALRHARIELQLADSAEYVDIIDRNYRYDKHYVYQLLSTGKTFGQMQSMMQADLNRFVGLKVTWKKVLKPCLVLSARDTARISYRSGSVISKADISMIHVNNIWVSSLVDILESNIPAFSDVFPLIDETKFKGKLGEIHIEADTNNLDTMVQEMAKTGLALSIQKRWVNVLVLSDPPHNKER